MNNKLKIFVLFVIGVIVYYGLLVVPPRLSGKNIVLFLLYLGAAIYLLLRKDDKNKDEAKKTNEK